MMTNPGTLTSEAMPPPLVSGWVWAYQDHFSANVGFLAKASLESLGIVDIETEAYMIARCEEGGNFIVLDHQLSADLMCGLKDLPAVYLHELAEHPDRGTFYGDSRAMNEKPSRLRGDSLRRALAKVMHELDAQDGQVSYVGHHGTVKSLTPDDKPATYHVVPMVRLPKRIAEATLTLRGPITLGERLAPVPLSLVESTVGVVLLEATKALALEEPGRGVAGETRHAEEIARQAASDFARTPAIAIKDPQRHLNLSRTLDTVSALLYENTEGLGRLYLCDPKNPAVFYALRLLEPVSVRDPRWLRKLLEVARGDLAIIASCSHVYGFGSLDPGYDHARQEVFTVTFAGHFAWDLSLGDTVLMRSRFGFPSLPRPMLTPDHFLENYQRLLPSAVTEDCQRALELCLIAATIGRGCMLIFAEDAESEATRLACQGTRVEPTVLTKELLVNVGGIDGSILLDPHCVCFAIGVILDGSAADGCTPSRGSRFNSAVRYTSAKRSGRLALVVSDDKTVDVLPMLRRRIRRIDIERNLSALEAATEENYHGSRVWLDDHRFYLREDDCKRANQAMARVRHLWRESGSKNLIVGTSEFVPNPEFDESYYLPD